MNAMEGLVPRLNVMDLGKWIWKAVRCSRSRMVLWMLSEVGVCKY